MGSFLKKYGTSTCLVCGHTLAYSEITYCVACIQWRDRIISRLENDKDLIRVVYVCARHSAPVPHALFDQSNAQATARAINVRLSPLLDFLVAQMMNGKLSPQGYGVLWVDISSDLTALYRGVSPKTETEKTMLYNERMRKQLYRMTREAQPGLVVSEFVKTREKGFDLLFPEASR